MTKNLVILLIIVTVLLLAVLVLAEQALDPRALELARKIDDLYRSKASYSQVEMEIVTPDWQRTLVLKAWSQGQDKTLIRILEPKKEAGVGTLRLGNEMWNYLPKTDKVIKIPPSMMMSSWMGSDFTNDDLVKEFTFVNDFIFRLVTPPEAEKGFLYLECRPKPGVPIVWDRIVIAVEEAGTLPVWQKFYDEKGRVARVMNYSQVKTFGRRTIPSVMEMVPQTKQGYKTVLRYRDVQFDRALKDDLFSLRTLQSGK
ncbi:MAG: outer membrane lipoprotein-sorting protein [Candidatus Aminicenantes bacterium]|nr:outer membrane lipoprotein-sorting protein [Candidatus Aminicenantes bacterium]